MRCGFINDDDSSFICERCNNSQPFKCEIDTESQDDECVPAPPVEGSETEEWDGGGGEEETEDDDGVEDWAKDDNEEDDKWDAGNDEEEWDDASPEPEDDVDDEEEAMEAPPQDTCPKCSRKTKEHWTNCAYCGTRLRDEHRAKCPGCGKPLKKEWTLCAYCGKKL